MQKEKLMGIDIDTIQHNHYLEVVVASSYDFQETIDKFPHVLDICRITGLKKVLIDYKEIQNQGCATEKSLYALSSQDLYQSYLKVGGHALQIAYVAPMVTNYELGVEIAENSELPFRLFDKLNEAHAWLGVKST